MGKIYKNGILFAGSTDSAKSVAFDNTDTGLEADNVQEAIEEVKDKVDTDINNLDTELNQKQDTLSAQNFSISLSCDSSLSDPQIKMSRNYGKIVHINGAISITSPGVWKTIGKIPSGYRPIAQLYFPLYKLGEYSKNVLYVDNNGNFGVNSVESGNDYFFDMVYITS